MEIKRQCLICSRTFIVNKYHPKKHVCCSNICNTKYWQKTHKKHRLQWAKEYMSKPEKRMLHNKTRRETDRRVRTEFRLKVLQKLGNKCKKCGFGDWRALQVDHVNGGGVKEVNVVLKSNRAKFYKVVLEDTTGKYQLLCANCNWIKRYENNEFRTPDIKIII